MGRLVRQLIVIAALCAGMLAAPAAQTVAPVAIQQFFTANGSPLSLGTLTVYVAGTTTLSTTYSNVDLDPSHANPNPITLDASGRPSVSGNLVEIFLRSGQSYKFVLKNAAGVIQWTADNISAVPSSSQNVDIDGTAGEDVLAGDLLYLSDGSGSKTAGNWFKADADLSYAGALPQLGFAVANISSGSSGSIRVAGRMTGLTVVTGTPYFASTTAGGLTLTAPAMARFIGVADSASTLVMAPNPRSTPIKPIIPCGRLTLTTGTPVTAADVTAATTLFFSPYGGCTSLTFYNGSTSWYQANFTQLSIAVPAVANQVYDVFVYDNAGTSTLELTAWTNDTTRATALVTQDGVYVKTGATTRLYLGTFRTTSVAGQTEDSAQNRLVWNYYNRVQRTLVKYVATNSWTYTTSTWRQMNGAAANQMTAVIGVQEAEVTLSVGAIVQNDTGGVAIGAAIGFDSTSSPAAAPAQRTAVVQIKAANEVVSVQGVYNDYPAVGYHTFVLLERSQATGTTTWYSQGSLFTFGEQTGASGWIR